MIPASRAIGAGTTDLSTTDNILNIDTTLGAAIINLPSVSTWFELKNKSGAIYDADGLRYTDVGGLAGTNSITFVAADGEFVNGSASIVVNTNGASGILTPSLDNGTWEFSNLGAAAGSGAYDVFGAVIIDNILVESVDLSGLEKVYAPQNGGSQGEAIHIGGDGVILTSVNMPDLTNVYGTLAVYTALNLETFNAPNLTSVTGALALDTVPVLDTLNLSAVTSVGGNYYILNSSIQSIDLSELVFVGTFLSVSLNSYLISITIGEALDCTTINFVDNALTEESVDSILANVDTAGFSKVILGYNTLVGSFEVGEVITGGTSGATAVITASELNSLSGNNVLGVFQTGETITGETSGATANITDVIKSILNLSGGTNSAPSAAGLASIVALEAKGWNVTTN